MKKLKYYYIRLKMKYHYYITHDMDRWEELWEIKKALK